MAFDRAQRKSYRITGRSLRRGLLVIIPIGGAFGIGEVILESAQGGPSMLSRFLPILASSIIVPVGMKLVMVPVETPVPKASANPLA
jgi:hypothetical protein